MKLVPKLTLAFVAGILVVHGVGAAITVAREQRQLYAEIEYGERVVGRSMSRTVSRLWTSYGEAEALRVVDEANDRYHKELRWIWLDAPPGDPHAATAPAAALSPIVHGEIVVVREPNAVYTYVPTPIPGERIGAIEVVNVLDDENVHLRSSIVLEFVTAFVLVLCSGVLAWALGRRLVSRPVGQLLDYTKTIETGDLTQRLVPPSRDELGELSVALNTMCDGLERTRDLAEAANRGRLLAIEQVRHADRLATVGALAAGVAHELGTPINVMEGHAQLIREDRTASPSVIQNAAVVTKQCKRMAAIIHDLLRFARRVPRTGETVDVGEITRETMSMCDVLARKRGVNVTIETCGELVAQIAPDAMKQILTNVVMNGIQAMPEGGALALRVAKERAAPQDGPDADYVCIRVEDSGVGMDEATRRRIFEPFFTTKDVGEGTGLGLSVALGIAKDHDGWIDVASEPQRGSVVAIYIPSHSEPTR